MSRVLPILFNGDMVRAILNGRKTVTRRIVKDNVDAILHSPYHEEHPEVPDKVLIEKLCNSPYQPGDILYVRETWSEWGCKYCEKECYGNCNPVKYTYRATGEWEDFDIKWKPSIHMPKEAARIWLKVTDVRVERLQDITEEQAECEGIRAYTKDGKLYKYAVTDDWWIAYHRRHRKLFEGTFWQDMPRTAREAFKYLWNSTIKKSDLDHYGWDENPWVWVIEFERCEKQEPCVIRGVEPAEDKRPCIGYSVSETDDEPCEMCKQCPICTGND